MLKFFFPSPLLGSSKYFFVATTGHLKRQLSYLTTEREDCIGKKTSFF